MVQIRVMDDDSEEVRRVLEILLPLVDACPLLHASSTTQLGHRGGGGRVVFDLSPAGPAPARSAADGGSGPEWVRAERADRSAGPARRGVAGAHRALPPGRSG